jgi:hypothetical protein
VLPRWETLSSEEKFAFETFFEIDPHKEDYPNEDENDPLVYAGTVLDEIETQEAALEYHADELDPPDHEEDAKLPW